MGIDCDLCCASRHKNEVDEFTITQEEHPEKEAIVVLCKWCQRQLTKLLCDKKRK